MAVDRYAAEHMKTEGRVLKRDKLVAGRGVQMIALVPLFLFLAATLVGGVGLVAGGGQGFSLAAAVGAPMTALMTFIWLTAMVVRTVVTDRQLSVHCGLSKQVIPMERIKSVKVAEQRNRIRTGKRLEPDGRWATSYLLRLGEYVDVLFETESGKERRLLFTPDDPHGVVEAIQKARAGGAKRVRVEPEAVEEEEAAVEEAETGQTAGKS